MKLSKQVWNTAFKSLCFAFAAVNLGACDGPIVQGEINQTLAATNENPHQLTSNFKLEGLNLAQTLEAAEYFSLDTDTILSSCLTFNDMGGMLTHKYADTTAHNNIYEKQFSTLTNEQKTLLTLASFQYLTPSGQEFYTKEQPGINCLVDPSDNGARGTYTPWNEISTINTFFYADIIIDWPAYVDDYIINDQTCNSTVGNRVLTTLCSDDFSDSIPTSIEERNHLIQLEELSRLQAMHYGKWSKESYILAITTTEIQAKLGVAEDLKQLHYHGHTRFMERAKSRLSEITSKILHTFDDAVNFNSPDTYSNALSAAFNSCTTDIITKTPTFVGKIGCGDLTGYVEKAKIFYTDNRTDGNVDMTPNLFNIFFGASFSKDSFGGGNPLEETGYNYTQQPGYQWIMHIASSPETAIL